MGAQEFTQTAKGKQPSDAFTEAREQALYDHGRSGYTGSIAEKMDFKVLTLPADTTPADFIETCFNNETHFCNDKWGAAACIKTGKDEYTFFGLASS